MEYQDYDYRSAEPVHSFHYIMPQLRRMLGHPGGPVLDLGCGNGAIAHALIAEGYDVYGVDASKTGIAYASKLNPGRFFVLDITTGRLPEELRGKRFGKVISTEMIDHLYDPHGFVDFVHSILSGGGDFIVVTTYHGYLKNLALAVTGKLDAHFTALWRGGRIKFFSRKTLEALLRKSGFEVVEFAGAGRLPLLWKSMLIKARFV